MKLKDEDSIQMESDNNKEKVSVSSSPRTTTFSTSSTSSASSSSSSSDVPIHVKCINNINVNLNNNNEGEKEDVGKINSAFVPEEQAEETKSESKVVIMNGQDKKCNNDNVSSTLREDDDNGKSKSSSSDSSSTSPIHKRNSSNDNSSSTFINNSNSSNMPTLDPNPSCSPKSSFKLTKISSVLSSSTGKKSSKKPLKNGDTNASLATFPAVEVSQLYYKPAPEPVQTLNPFKRNPLKKQARKATEFILSGIDLCVPQGGIYCLIGPSGCGKTTLLRCVVGVLKQSSGEVRVFGYKPHERNGGIPGPKVGYMPQECALYGDMTVEEVLKYFGKLNCTLEEDIQRRTDFLLGFLDMTSCRKRLVANLSGGQMRRVSFAAALIHSPPLLILDEPTAGVDPLLRDSIWKHLRVLTRKEGITVIITTHYVEEARQADVVGLMRKGLLLAQEPPRQLMERNGVKSLEDAFLKLCTDLLVQKRDSKLQKQKSVESMQRQESRESVKSRKSVVKMNGKSDNSNLNQLNQHDNPSFTMENEECSVKISDENNATIKTNNNNHSIINIKQEGNCCTKSDSTNEITSLDCSKENGQVKVNDTQTKSNQTSKVSKEDNDKFTVVVDSSLDKNNSSLRKKEKPTKTNNQRLVSSITISTDQAKESQGENSESTLEESKEPKMLNSNAQTNQLKSQLRLTTIKIEAPTSSPPSPSSPSSPPISSELKQIISPKPPRKLTPIARYWLMVMAIFWKNLIRNKRHIEVILFQFFMPVVIVILFCYCIGGIPKNIKLAVVNDECPHSASEIAVNLQVNDGHEHPLCRGKHSALFLSTIDPFLIDQYEYTYMSDALNAVKSGHMWAVMHIPANFTSALRKRVMFASFGSDKNNGDDDEEYEYETDKEIDKEDENNTIKQSTILVHADLTEKVISITMQRSMDDSFLRFTRLALAADGKNPNIMRPPIELGTPVYGNDDKHRGYTEFMAPGILINISFVMAAGLTALVFLMDRRDGTLERHLVCGVSASQILIAHVMIRLLTMAIASAIVLALVILWLELPTRGPIFWTFLLLVLQSCAGMSYGMLVSSICRQENSAAFLISSTVVANLTLCGMIWPIEAIPYYIRWLCYLMPSTLPTESLRGLLNRGWSVGHLSVQLGFISTLAWFFIFTMLSAKLFRFYR